MPHLRACVGLIFGLGLGLLACDRKWDFECTAVWTDNGKEVWRKVQTYPQMDHEKAATQRCKEEMLEARPRGADQAVCECKGVE
ncbi:MAG: hypothetical protein R6X02_02375 [Enhygromyxa sp.]